MSRAREFADLAGSADSGGLTGRNILINGAMQVAQRGTSGSFAHDGTTDGLLSVDRFTMALGGTHEELDGTLAQVADHPLSANGKSLKWTTGTAEGTYAAEEYAYVAQIIEAQNLQHINNGNSNAVPLTLSFYVKSSVTGTFAVGLYKEDTTARIFNQTYTISSANTWEKKTITFAGDTGGGGIANDNGRGFYVNWHIAAGSNAVGGGSTSGWKNYGGLSDWADGQATNAVATTASATWQITDCQLEVGEKATPFEHLSQEEDLLKCQRYFHMIRAVTVYSPVGVGRAWSTSRISSNYYLPRPMRANPTISINNASYFEVAGVGGSPNAVYNDGAVGSFSGGSSGVHGVKVGLGSSSTPFTTGTIYQIESNNSTNMEISITAEL